MNIIYADSVFLLNFIVDYLLLLATGKICALPLMRRRMIPGALWGGVYALLALLSPELFAPAAVKLLSGIICAAIAFAGLGPMPRTALVFFAVSAAFGGAVYAAGDLAGLENSSGALSVSLRSLVLAFALSYAALSLVFRGMGRRSAREVREVELSLGGRKAVFQALRDTGNELMDPSGRPVLVAEWSAIAELFPLLPSPPRDAAGLFMALSALEGMAGRCRLLSCRTVSDSGAMLAAFRPDSILIGGSKSRHSLVAVTLSPISPDGDCKALF